MATKKVAIFYRIFYTLLVELNLSMDAKFFNLAFLFLLTLNVVMLSSTSLPLLSWIGLVLLSIGITIVLPTDYRIYGILWFVCLAFGAIFTFYQLFAR